MRQRHPATRSVTLAIALLAAIAFGASDARAASATASTALKISLGAGSSLWIEGTSNVHDWMSRSKDLKLTFKGTRAATQPTNPGDLRALIATSAIRDVDLEVPVRSLLSEKKGLDKNLYKALQADAHPVIRFHIDEYRILPHEGAGDTLRLRAWGPLTIDGTERTDTLNVSAYRAPAGLWIVGGEPLRMSEFGIRPPTMMLGTLRVADKLRVGFKLLLVAGDDKLSMRGGN